MGQLGQMPQTGQPSAMTGLSRYQPMAYSPLNMGIYRSFQPSVYQAPQVSWSRAPQETSLQQLQMQLQQLMPFMYGSPYMDLMGTGAGDSSPGSAGPSAGDAAPSDSA